MKRSFLVALSGVSFFLARPTLIQAQPKTPAAASKPAPAVAPLKASGPAAEVNGEVIPLEDLNTMSENIKASEPAFQTDSEAARKALSDLRAQLLEELIATRLLTQEARRVKTIVDPNDAKNALKEFKANFKTEAEFGDWLRQSGKTSADIQKVLSDEILLRQYSQNLTRDVTVSGDDISAYYRAHLDQFTLPPGVHARHILLALNPASPPEEKARVKKRASELIKQLKSGADFGALAKANSDDSSTRDSGGDLGSFARGASGIRSKAFEDAAFAAKVGQVVGPVESDFGIHIIKVDELIPSKVLALKQVQDDPRLKALLLKQKVQARLDQQIAQLKASAKINRYL